MANAVEFTAFRLKKGIEVAEFLRVSDEFNEEFLSKQQGYISRQLLVEGEKWVDYVLWETEKDIHQAFRLAEDDVVASKYLSCINLNSCKSNFFTIEKEY